jgi:hypothetical protein
MMTTPSGAKLPRFPVAQIAVQRALRPPSGTFGHNTMSITDRFTP